MSKSQQKSPEDQKQEERNQEKRTRKLEKQKDVEEQQNYEELKILFGSPIKYGDVVQFEHLKSEKFLTLLFVIPANLCFSLVNSPAALLFFRGRFSRGTLYHTRSCTMLQPQ